MDMNVELSIPWSEARSLLTGSLEDVGLTCSRSFDLQSARESLLDPDLCPCPHHGAAQCTCQYIVFVVREVGRAPITVELHGYDDRTYIAIAQPMDGDIDTETVGLIGHVFERLAGANDLPNE